MPVGLHLRFPAGRYHATAWGHHVNEGVVDWPPAPLRVLRALYAQSLDCDPRPERALVERLFQKLSAPPAYRIPSYTTGHTRHYMPDGSGKPDSRVKVLDSFIAVGDDEAAAPLVMQWPDLELESSELALLDELARRLTYLGRAESWCDATVTTEAVDDAIGPGEGEGTPIPLLAVRRDAKDLLSILATDTAELRKKGADLPPDTHWLRYFVGPPVSRPRQRPRQVEATAVLVALEAGAQPRILDTIEIAQAIRRAVLSRAGDSASSTLTGRLDKRPRADGHAHAHFLPFDLKGDSFLRHCLIYAEEGFSAEEIEAIAAVEKVRRRREREEVFHTHLVEVGTLDTMSTLPIVGDGHEGCRVWTSATPYLLSRHPKPRKTGLVDGPEAQLRRELDLRRAKGQLPNVRAIRTLSVLEQRNARTLRWLEFRRWRGKHKPAVPHGYGYEIEFEEPVRGPLTLGFGAHFGLGLFRVAGR